MDGGPGEKAKTSALKQQVAHAVKRSRRKTRVRRKGQDVCSVVEALQSEPALPPRFHDQATLDLQGSAYDAGPEEDDVFSQVNATADFIYPITGIGAISDLATASSNTSMRPCENARFGISDNTVSFPSNVRERDQISANGVINFNANSNIWNDCSDTNVVGNVSLSSSVAMASSEMSSMVSLPDSVLLLHYIEEVYPWQFRHYSRPPLNKAWLLWMIFQSRPLFLAVLAVSSSHMNLRHPPDNLASAHIEERAICDKYNLAAKELRHCVERYEDTMKRPQSSTVLLSVVMLMFFNIAHLRVRDWRPQLQVALSILRSQSSLEKNTASPAQPITPESLDLPAPRIVQQGTNVTAAPGIGHVMWFHVLSSLADSSASSMDPDMSDIYTRLLDSDESGIDFEYITGCQNWVVFAILSIYSLRTWKKRAMTAGSLSIWELIERAQPARESLQKGIDDVSMRLSHYETTLIKADSITARDQHEKNLITCSFARAALVLLEVVVSGASPGLAEVEKGVNETRAVIERVPDQYLVQSLSWPICVAGCMAQPQHHSFFKGLLHPAGQLKLGVFSNVLKVLERCWWLRESESTRKEVDWNDAIQSLQTDLLLF
ncbi:MAG: hypothetical protein Q9160_009128 [Pyrenula sp. 1 TL-2023]